MTQPTFKTFTYTVPVGGSVEVARAADFITALDATAPFKISMDSAPLTEFEAGLTYTTEGGFSHLQVINTGAEPLTVKLGFGRGDVKDARMTFTGGLDVNVTAPPVFSTGAPVNASNGAVTQLAASNPTRSEIIISNDEGGKVYIGGDAGAGAGEGLPLGVGASVVLTTSAAIYARNDTGEVVALHVAEIEQGA